jgi:hypothetical protein
MYILVPEDRNKDYYNSPNILAENKQSFMMAILCVICFFTYGLYFTLFFFLTKFTKTLYRCFLYGWCCVIIDVMLIFASGLTQYFQKNMLYTTVASLIGFISAYFIDGDMGFNIVSDFRKIEIEENS